MANDNGIILALGQWDKWQDWRAYDPKGLSPTLDTNCERRPLIIVRDMEHDRKRGEHIAFKTMPNGDIRAYQDDTADKRGVSELMITDPKNISPTILAGQPPKIIDSNNNNNNSNMGTTVNNVTSKNKALAQLPPELEGKEWGIRKLTSRETFRLMDVDDADIDRIKATGISNSAQYKLAGNSIVVNVLYHIFRKMFIETGYEGREPTLF